MPLVLPQMDQMFFLPQKPYMPIGSLRQQLMFPSGHVGNNRGAFSCSRKLAEVRRDRGQVIASSLRSGDIAVCVDDVLPSSQLIVIHS